MALKTYVNADHAGCQDTRRSTSGSAQFLGDKLVSWSSKKFPCIVITSVLLLSAATMSSTPDPSTLTYVTISFESSYFKLHPAFQIEESMSLKRLMFLTTDNIANENVPALAPTRSDDQILPFAAWLDENRFILDANLLREALEITPIDQAHQFVSPPSGDAIIDFVNELGYTEEIHFVSRMAVNNLYQPWRAILLMINQCLTGKTSGFDRPIYPVIQMLWGIITSINVDYAELMWEEFVQAMQRLFFRGQAI
ncbi:retrovirus-related pol polyprotein from transposon TNT 1-94 [Tanacetum coccineum]